MQVDCCTLSTSFIDPTVVVSSGLGLVLSVVGVGSIAALAIIPLAPDDAQDGHIAVPTPEYIVILVTSLSMLGLVNTYGVDCADLYGVDT